MAALAVRVVHRRVEDRHPAQPGVVLDDHRDDVDVRVDVDPELERALAERAVAQDRRRDDPPADRLADDVPGRDLAVGQRPVREVVERPLAGGRLVDGLDDDRVLGSAGRRAGPGTSIALLRRADDPPDDLDLALAQDVERRAPRSITGTAVGRAVS